MCLALVTHNTRVSIVICNTSVSIVIVNMPLFNQQQPTDAPFFINASLNTTGDYAGLSEWAIAFETVLNMVIVPAMFSFITLIGIVGNVAVIIIIISRRNMRSLVNILLLNLACGDFVFLTLGVPFMAYHYASLSWQLGEWVCKMVQYVLFVSVYLTIYTLVSIAIARFIVIVYSNSVVASYWLQSTKFAFACIVLLWLVMTLINLPILTLYELRYFGSYVYCGVNDEEKGRRLFLSFFFCAYLCPLLLIATFHFGISRYLKSRLPNNTVEIAESNGTAGKDNISRSCAQTSKPYVDARERNEKVSRLLLSIVVVFAACWLPMHLLLLLTYFGVQPLNWPLQVRK